MVANRNTHELSVFTPDHQTRIQRNNSVRTVLVKKGRIRGESAALPRESSADSRRTYWSARVPCGSIVIAFTVWGYLSAYYFLFSVGCSRVGVFGDTYVWKWRHSIISPKTPDWPEGRARFLVAWTNCEKVVLFRRSRPHMYSRKLGSGWFGKPLRNQA